MLAAAPSKVPFYVLGGLLAFWAVVLAAWGISHPRFPDSPRQGRLVMLTSFALVVAAMTSAVLTAGEGVEGAAGAHGAAPAATGRTLDLAADPAGGLAYDKQVAAVFPGRVTVRFTNDSSVGHNVTIAQGSRTLGATDTITKAKATFALNVSKGEYVFFCSVPGHRQAGMQGTLVVE